MQLERWRARLPRPEHAALQRAFVVGLGKKLGKSASSAWYASAGAALFDGFAKGVGTALAFVAVLGVLALTCRSGWCAGLAAAGVRPSSSAMLQRELATTAAPPPFNANAQRP